MDNQPSFDRSLLIPIFISGCSVIGIVLALLIGRSLSAPAEVPTTPSATRFSYVYLGTEPAITTPLTEETQIEETQAGATEGPVGQPTNPSPPALRTPTRPGPNTPIILPSATGNSQGTTTTATPTVTSASLPPLSAGTYDDGHQDIVYNGWDATGALHVSFQPGNTVSFRFIGRQLRLIYQGGATLGQVRILIDSTPYTLDQSSGNEWASDLLTNSTHSVTITHTGGGSVNLDQVIIPNISNTPTPTLTPTRTSPPP